MRCLWELCKVSYGAETWALTGKLEEILKSCDSRMLRCKAQVRWQERTPVKWWRRDVVWEWYRINWDRKSYNALVMWEGNGGKSVEISGGNGSIGEKESRKKRENLERYSEKGFGTTRSGSECGIGSRRWRKIIASSTPAWRESLKGLKTIMMIMMMMRFVQLWPSLLGSNQELIAVLCTIK